MGKTINGTNQQIENIVQLKNYLNDLSREDLNSLDLTRLPTWGQGPENTSEVFSWDTTVEPPVFLVWTGAAKPFSTCSNLEG